jgi:hypothetical protein
MFLCNTSNSSKGIEHKSKSNFSIATMDARNKWHPNLEQENVGNSTHPGIEDTHHPN